MDRAANAIQIAVPTWAATDGLEQEIQGMQQGISETDCDHCNAKQGDWHDYCEPDGLFSVEMRVKTSPGIILVNR